MLTELLASGFWWACVVAMLLGTVYTTYASCCCGSAPAPPQDCNGNLIPAVLTATVTADGAGPGGLCNAGATTDTFSITYTTVPFPQWIGFGTRVGSGGCLYGASMSCSSPVVALSAQCGVGVCASGAVVPASYSPFSATGTFGDGTGQNITVTITE